MSTERRSYSAQFKLETVLEGIRSEKSIAQICRERGIKDSLYYKWRDQFMSQALHLFEDKRNPSVTEGNSERIAELERMVGRLAVENDILKKASSLVEAHRRRNGS